MGPVTNWVFKPNAMQLLQQLRRRVKAEFGFTLRFKEEDLVEQLARVKSNTVDDATQSILAQVEEMRGIAFGVEEQTKVSTYRGQVVLQQPAKEKDIYQMIYGDELAEHTQSKRTKSQKMYRGRPVAS
jgi:hypothetical protein